MQTQVHPMVTGDHLVLLFFENRLVLKPKLSHNHLLKTQLVFFPLSLFSFDSLQFHFKI